MIINDIGTTMPIRQAEPKDFDDIQRLYQTVLDFEHENGDQFQDKNFPNSDTANKFYANIVNAINGHIGYVFEEDSIVKGYVSLRVQDPSEYVHRKNISILQLQTMGVDERYRNQGIGKRLVEYSKQVAKDMGFTHFRVVSLAENSRARHLYKQCGFHEQEIIHEMEL
jgi:ribosomal protein S18 acetylase RimI-like enzyme